MANIGYIQVVRHCNHFCGFCSNPSSAYHHTFETMARLVDDLVDRGYFGVVLTGGEPTLHPELPRIAAHARSRGLHVRMITNGWRLSDPDFARELAEAGLELVHVSIYSVRPDVEERIRGVPDTLDRAHEALANAGRFGIEANVNCVINRLNADHLDENVRVLVERHPHVRHFVWNNLDPSMGRAEVNQDQFTPRLADFELSLARALRFLQKGGRTFRVERVPLCYMTDFAWASTETRKIVKGEERVVHFLDAKQTVRQTDWEHVYTEACRPCSLRNICGGLFDRGQAYDPEELAPVFVPMDPIVERIISDPADPSYPLRSLADWRPDFERRVEEARQAPPRPKDEPPRDPSAPPVGLVTEESLRRFTRSRAADERRAARSNVELEPLGVQTPEEG
ncbi:MAG: radical SAM protein [Sandaracinaceae bacterium]|nr:radical SAM protein [Sandaracinaceae bacterium]